MNRPDVTIVGAGPAGATAALVLARAGARVVLLDRVSFPRPKLCGDTLNPGTLALLQRLGVKDAVSAGGLHIRGMRLTGPGVDVEAEWGAGLFGLAQPRCEFDRRLLDEAIRAGAVFQPGMQVTAPVVEGPAVAGVTVRRPGGATSRVGGGITIAADGRRSVLAVSLGLTRQPAAPRRWAIGSYYREVGGGGPFGEMHVREDHYIGVAPLPGGLVNAILVVPLHVARRTGLPLRGLLDHFLSRDRELSERFAGARRATAPTVLGPLAVDGARAAVPGLLLAGDAAGFIDPMTGDGMRFAIAGGMLAAEAALDALAHGWVGVPEKLTRARQAAFGGKWRFNRAARTLTGSPAAIRALSAVAPALPPILKWAVRWAGDCP